MAYLRVVKNEASASINGRSPGVRGGVDLLPSMELDGLELGLPNVSRRMVNKQLSFEGISDSLVEAGRGRRGDHFATSASGMQAGCLMRWCPSPHNSSGIYTLRYVGRGRQRVHHGVIIAIGLQVWSNSGEESPHKPPCGQNVCDHVV